MGKLDEIEKRRELKMLPTLRSHYVTTADIDWLIACLRDTQKALRFVRDDCGYQIDDETTEYISQTLAKLEASDEQIG